MALFTQPLTVTANSNNTIPNPSNPSYSVNVSSLGQTIQNTIWGVAPAAPFDFSCALCGNTDFQNTMQALDFSLFRWNTNAGGNTWWGDAVFGSDPSNPNWSWLDNWFNNQAKLVPTGQVLAAVGPAAGSAVQSGSYWATAAKQLANKFIAEGRECFLWEFSNEMNGNMDLNTWCSWFNQVADALHSINPNYKMFGPVLAGVDDGWMQTFASTCGSRAAVLDWHEYTNGGNGVGGDPASMYNTVSTESSRVRSDVSGTAAANYPLFLGEYSTSYNCNDPMMQQIYGAVYTALLLQDGYDSDSNFQYGGIWEVANDGQCGVIQNNTQVAPAGYYLSYAGHHLGGRRASVSDNIGSGLKTTATINGKNFGVQIINSNQSAQNNVSIAFQNGNALTAKSWIISPSQTSGQETTNLTSLTGFNLPANSIFILSGTLE